MTKLFFDYWFTAKVLIISVFCFSVKPFLQQVEQMLPVGSSRFYRRGVHRKNKHEMIVIKESSSIKKRQISKETCQKQQWSVKTQATSVSSVR